MVCYAKQQHRLGLFGILWSLWWATLWMWPYPLTALASVAFFYAEDPDVVLRFKESFSDLVQSQFALLLDF
jgi:hypothetical protein